MRLHESALRIIIHLRGCWTRASVITKSRTLAYTCLILATALIAIKDSPNFYEVNRLLMRDLRNS